MFKDISGNLIPTLRVISAIYFNAVNKLDSQAVVGENA